MKKNRTEILEKIDQITDKPLMVLSFVWLILIIIDLSVGLNRDLLVIFYIIWGIFFIDFVIEIILAPNKLEYLKKSWLNIISLIIPGFRLLNIFRGLWILQILKLYTSVVRTLEGLALAFEKRGFTFIFFLTAIVIFSGAAGILHFENPKALAHANIHKIAGIRSYWDALWWTAMMMTTMGSDYWPKTVGGRILGWLIAVYAFTFFGYITAVFASYFVDTDRKSL